MRWGSHHRCTHRAPELRSFADEPLATEGGNPFANARWQDAWTIATLYDARWKAIRDELRGEVQRWQEALRQPREVMAIELGGMLGSVVHQAYHLGAIRQVHAGARGPKDPSEH